MQKTRVVIVDDHPALREGLKTIINRETSFKVVGEAGTANDGIELIKDIIPDLAIVDISLPDKNGIALVREIKRDLPDIKILILSMHAKGEFIARAFKAGADGYLTKESATNKLVVGLKSIVEGNYYLDSQTSREIVDILKATQTRINASDDKYRSLTNREQEVLRLFAEGLSSKEIADQLNISHKTADNHHAHIMKKLKLRNIAELIRYAAKIGLIDVDAWV